ncbi:MAG: hypothetical protein ACLFOC_04520 [Campylobacterales bacterium]
MRLENILDVIDGELLNSPAVSSFSGVASEIENVKHKYLFFAFSRDSVKQALQRGAYGIVTQDRDVEYDEESAFIYVEDIDEAFLRFFRFRLLESPIKRYLLTIEEAVIVESISSKKELIVFEDMCRKRVDEFFEHPKDVVFVNSVFFNRLGVECVVYEKRSAAEVYASGLFSCEISLEKLYKVNFCSFFAYYLASSISFLLENDYELNRAKLFEIPMLEPVFLNKNIEQVDFGKSSRVAICESRARVFIKAIEFFVKRVKWGKNLYLAPIDSGIEDHRVIIYKDSEDLGSILEANEFNYALILVPKSGNYDRLFKTKETRKALF